MTIQLLRRRRQEEHTLKACLDNLGPRVKQEVKGALGCSSVGRGMRPDEDRGDDSTPPLKVLKCSEDPKGKLCSWYGKKSGAQTR